MIAAFGLIDPDELHDALQKIKHEFQIAKKDYEAVFNAGTASMTPSQIASVLRDFIIKNYSDDINLNLIADNMNYSPGYLTKIFCQAYDCTPTKYLTNLRMHHAQKLLLNEPSLSVRQIGEMCGYHDQGYFSRIFKKHTGKSPLEYRDEKEEAIK